MKNVPPVVTRLRKIAEMARQVSVVMKAETDRKTETLKKIQEIRRNG